MNTSIQLRLIGRQFCAEESEIHRFLHEDILLHCNNVSWKCYVSLGSATFKLTVSNHRFSMISKMGLLQILSISCDCHIFPRIHFPSGITVIRIFLEIPCIRWKYTLFTVFGTHWHHHFCTCLNVNIILNMVHENVSMKILMKRLGPLEEKRKQIYLKFPSCHWCIEGWFNAKTFQLASVISIDL